MKSDNTPALLPSWQSVRAVLKNTALEVVLFSFLVNLLVLATPIYSLQIFDRISISRSYESLTMLLIAVVICIVALLCFEALRKKTLLQSSQKLSSLLMRFSIQQEARSEINPSMDDYSPPKIQQGFSVNQLDRLCRNIESPAILGLIDISLSPLFIFLLFTLHPLFGTTVAVINVLLLAVCGLQYHTDNKGKIDSSRSLFYALQWFKQDYLPNWIRATEIQSSRHANLLLIDQQAQQQRKARSHHRQIFAITSLRHLAQIAIPTAGGMLLVTQEISMGVLLAAMMLSMKSVIAWEQLFQHSATLTSLLEDLKTLKREIAQAQEESRIKKHCPATVFTGKMHIELPSQEKITLEKGTRMAIVGPSGSGKSSLLGSLIGVFRTTSPLLKAWYDDYSIRSLNRAWFHGALAYIRPCREIPCGSVRNFLLDDAHGDSNDERLIEFSQLTGLHSRILPLELGYDTNIEKEPYLQSPGVISLLLLARALIQEPEVVFIDDLDATLDKAGLEGFERALDYFQKKKCNVIFTTQRKTLVSQCDHVLLKDNNHIYHINPNPTSIGNVSESFSPILQRGA